MLILKQGLSEDDLEQRLGTRRHDAVGLVSGSYHRIITLIRFFGGRRARLFGRSSALQ